MKNKNKKKTVRPTIRMTRKVLMAAFYTNVFYDYLHAIPSDDSC